MNPIFIIIIVIVILFSSFFAFKVHHSLVLLKKRIASDYQKIMQEIDNRIALVNTYLPLVRDILTMETLNDLQGTVDKLSNQMTWENLFDWYIDLEKNIERMKIEVEDKNIQLAKWDRKFQENKRHLDKARDTYNDDILGMNNKVDLFPFSIIAGICGYKKYIYFRSES